MTNLIKLIAVALLFLFNFGVSGAQTPPPPEIKQAQPSVRRLAADSLKALNALIKQAETTGTKARGRPENCDTLWAQVQACTEISSQLANLASPKAADDVTGPGLSSSPRSPPSELKAAEQSLKQFSKMRKVKDREIRTVFSNLNCRDAKTAELTSKKTWDECATQVEYFLKTIVY